MLINPYVKQVSSSLKQYNEEDVIKETKLKIVEDSKIDLSKISEEVLRKNIEKILVENFSQSDEKVILKIQEIIVNDILRYGILQKYIDDKSITDIRVTRYDKIFIKRNINAANNISFYFLILFKFTFLINSFALLLSSYNAPKNL